MSTSSLYDRKGAGPSQKTLFASLLAEGELLFKKKDWARSADALTKAVEINEDSIPVYILRAKCYLNLGQPLKGLLDSERILKREPANYKGILLKAEALFDAGNFEFSSINFHRGLRIRPDISDFKLGVQKCKEAILSCFPEEGIQPIRAAATDNASTLEIMTAPGSPQKIASVPSMSGDAALLMKYEATVPLKKKHNTKTDGYLGSLSADRAFLEEFRAEAIDWDNAEDVRGIAEKGISYIASRTEFWRHMKESKVRAPQPPTTRPPSARRPLSAKKEQGKAIDSRVRSSESRTAASAASDAPTRLRDRKLHEEQTTMKNGEKAQVQRKKKKTKRSISAKSNHAKDGNAVPRLNMHEVDQRPWSSPMGAMTSLQSEKDGDPVVCFEEPRPHTAVEQGAGRRKGRESGVSSARQSLMTTNSTGAKKTYIEQTRYSLQTLENINAAISSGDYELAMTFAQSYLARLPMLNVADKPRLLANLYCSMGMAKYVSAGLCCYELGQLTVAAAHQRRALEIAVRCNYRDVYLRSVEYLGLTIQRSGDFQQAISVWETKLKFVKKTEVPFLYARISECYLNLENNDRALKWGHDALQGFATLKISVQAGTEEEIRALIGDGRTSRESVIQDIARGELQCILLVATAMEAAGRNEEALELYKKELDLAKELSKNSVTIGYVEQLRGYKEDRQTEAEALSHLGNIYLRMGEPEKSIGFQLEASKLSSQSSPVKLLIDTNKGSRLQIPGKTLSE